MSKTKPRVLIFQRKISSLVYHAIQCLARAGTFEIHFLTSDPDEPLRFSRLVRKVHYFEPCRDPAASLEQLKCFLRKERMDVLLTLSSVEIEFMVYYADDELRSLVSLPDQPSKYSFQIADSKIMLASFMKSHDIPYPRSVRFNPADPDTENDLAKLPLPIIAKTEWGGGGAAMRVFNNRDELIPYLHNEFTDTRPIIVQQFIQGIDLGCAVFCRNGKILCSVVQKKITSGANPLAASKAIQFIDDQRVLDIVGLLMESLHWNGIAQVDLVQQESTKDLFVLEINPRYWGSMIGALKMGINFPEISCRIALGLPVVPMVYSKGKYITPQGYILYVLSLIKGQNQPERFRLSDSNFDGILSDPIPRILEFFNPKWR